MPVAAGPTRARIATFAALVVTLALALAASFSAIARADGAPFAATGASLTWSGSQELQKAPPFNGSNYFSAGTSDGTQATYKAQDGNVQIVHEAANGSRTPATYATRGTFIGAGAKQLAVLSGGDAKVAADGSARIAWTGSWTTNFYGGLAPFTISDPVLTVDAAGKGKLTARLSGYAASQDDPFNKTPIPAVPDVVVATFSNVDVDVDHGFVVTPDYAGVIADVPSGQMPQNRTAAGWGAWPQSFVNFQFATGLSSYWYSSGGAADPYKVAAPFTVGPAQRVTDSPAPGGQAPGAPQPAPQPQPQPIAQPAPIKPGTIDLLKQAQTIDGQRRASVASVSCPTGGAACTVSAPKRITVKIGGKRYTFTVIAPKSVKAGKKATLRVRLSAGALKGLKGRKATVKVKISITTGGKKTTRTVKVVVRAKAAR